jgi:hypothetical protein
VFVFAVDINSVSSAMACRLYYIFYLCCLLTKLRSEQIFWFDICKVMWVHQCKCILICHISVNLQLCLLLQNSFGEFQVQKVELQVAVTN